MPSGYQIQRVYWGARSAGSFNWDWDEIHADSVVLIAASEYDSGAPPDVDGSAQRIIGDTLIRATSPRTGRPGPSSRCHIRH
jgi:hypothetical protein